VVADIDDGSPLVDEEQFGPVIPVVKYTEVEDAIARAEREEGRDGVRLERGEACAEEVLHRREVQLAVVAVAPVRRHAARRR
jgi:acyl-CoA reductase-like NAD-dependent aldehyde dehydrogenase